MKEIKIEINKKEEMEKNHEIIMAQKNAEIEILTNKLDTEKTRAQDLESINAELMSVSEKEFNRLISKVKKLESI